jgi:hypothetical protein
MKQSIVDPWFVFTTIFFFIAYEWAQYARVFVPGRLFKNGLMFSSKTGAYPREASKLDHFRAASKNVKLFSVLNSVF